MTERPFTAEASAKHSFKRQLHTTHVGAVGWKTAQQFSHDMRGEGGSWIGVCVPLGLGLSFENSELTCSTA